MKHTVAVHLKFPNFKSKSYIYILYVYILYIYILPFRHLILFEFSSCSARSWMLGSGDPSLRPIPPYSIEVLRSSGTSTDMGIS